MLKNRIGWFMAVLVLLAAAAAAEEKAEPEKIPAPYGYVEAPAEEVVWPVKEVMKQFESINPFDRQMAAAVQYLSGKKVTARTEEDIAELKKTLEGDDDKLKCVALTIISSSETDIFNKNLIRLLESEYENLKKVSKLRRLPPGIFSEIPDEERLKKIKTPGGDLRDHYLKSQIGMATIAILAIRKEKKAIPLMNKLLKLRRFEGMAREALWKIGGNKMIKEMLKDVEECEKHDIYKFGKNVLEHLLRAYRTKETEKERDAMLCQFSRITDPATKPRMRELIREGRKTGDDKLEDAASRALLSMVNEDDLDIAFEMAADENPLRRHRGVQLMAKIRSEKTIDRLIELVNDSYQGVRLAAIRTLGRLKVKKALPHLKKILNDEDEDVAGEANRAVNRIEDKRMGPPHRQKEKESKDDKKGSTSADSSSD